ncbi:MAG: uracil-DNA glycosylase [Gemmatimonadaceae bacterium]|nr:uracil-DNA glycosylase [Gemmatimonadaceae bacterium]
MQIQPAVEEMIVSNQELAFRALALAARDCDACPRMRGRRRVLGAGSGAIRARTLFVAEAPGRLGAEMSGIPLHGDQTGKNFERLLAAVGLRREDVFITNAVLCNPQSPSGTNDKPTRAEIVECNHFLSETIAVVDPALVIALGVSALAALSRVERHGLTLRLHLARPTRWFDRHLAALYHPSPRTRVFRSFGEQVDDLARCLQSSVSTGP